MSLYNLVKILRYECFGFFNLRSKLTLYDFQENCPIFELKWNVEGSLARSELKPLVKVVQNDLYGLFTRLREYAILSRNRTELIQEFDDNFKRQFKIQRGVKYTYTFFNDFFLYFSKLQYLFEGKRSNVDMASKFIPNHMVYAIL